MDAFVSLGSTFSPSDDLVAQLNKFVCLMYGDKTSENVNKCRFALFKLGKCSDDMLPRTCESLLQHIRRTNYQAAIWRQCLDAEMDIPPPGCHGWWIVDGVLKIVWMTRPPAPDSILEFIHCGCKTGCETHRCSCKKAMMQCTDVCTCAGCMNAAIDDEQSDEEMEEEEELGLDMDDDI